MKRGRESRCEHLELPERGRVCRVEDVQPHIAGRDCRKADVFASARAAIRRVPVFLRRVAGLDDEGFDARREFGDGHLGDLPGLAQKLAVGDRVEVTAKLEKQEALTPEQETMVREALKIVPAAGKESAGDSSDQLNLKPDGD